MLWRGKNSRYQLSSSYRDDLPLFIASGIKICIYNKAIQWADYRIFRLHTSQIDVWRELLLGLQLQLQLLLPLLLLLLLIVHIQSTVTATLVTCIILPMVHTGTYIYMEYCGDERGDTVPIPYNTRTNLGIRKKKLFEMSSER